MTTNETNTTTNYPEPSPELIADIRQRLSELPREVLERTNDALMHKPIQYAGSILWKAGLCLSSHELYEYRKTFFPPNSLVDPDTQGAPILRPDVGPVPPPGSSGNSAVQDPPSRISPGEGTGPAGGALLLNDLRDLLIRYVVLPELAAETLALWVVHTYAFTLRQVTTYIGVVSPEKRCGKTTLLELLARLANRARPATNISPPALFRVIQETRPTLIIDEADTFLHGRDEMAGILNAGYRRSNSYVVRVAEGKKSGSTNFVEYSCWCPKVMAAIGRLPDTLADRCIVITMQRKMAGENCERMRRLDGA